MTNDAVAALRVATTGQVLRSEYFEAYGMFMYWYAALDRTVAWIANNTSVVLPKDGLTNRVAALKAYCAGVEAQSRKTELFGRWGAARMLRLALDEALEVHKYRNDMFHSGTTVFEHLYPATGGDPFNAHPGSVLDDVVFMTLRVQRVRVMLIDAAESMGWTDVPRLDKEQLRVHRSVDGE